MTAYYEYKDQSWLADRFKTITRDYSPAEVARLSGSLRIEYTLADVGARKLWDLITKTDYVNTFGAYTGNQGMQMVKAGLKAIYLSGWQVAADANLAGQMYPDQSLYPADSVPSVVKRINNALRRADEIYKAEGDTSIDWYAPIMADAEAGFGGNLNAFELMKAMIEAGAAGVHFEDQLASEKKCGHLGGKVLVPTQSFIRTLNAARLAADVCGVPTVLCARTDAESATLLTSDVDETDREFIDYDAGRTSEGFYQLKPGTGLQNGIKRAIAYADYADLIWLETSTPDLKQAKLFAESVRKEKPNQMFAYNCSPSFNWKKHLDDQSIAKFQQELGAMGYKFQFITLASFHNNNFNTFNLAQDYSENGMSAYVKLQEAEFAAANRGFTCVKHQREVGTGYFDAVSLAVSQGESSTTALKDSTESAQF